MVEKFEQQKNERITADRIVEMIENGGNWEAALQDPNVDSEVLDELVSKVTPIDISGGIKAEIIRSPNVSEKTVLKIAEDKNFLRMPRTIIAIVENGNQKATSEVITLVKQSATDPVSLSDIGRHPNTPIEIIRGLLADKFYGKMIPVCFGIAESPNLTPNLYEELARDESWAVRSGIAEHADAPSDIRENLRKDNHWFVRVKIAESDQSSEMLTGMASDEDEYVRSAVLGNPNTPSEVKERLEKSENKDKMRKEVKMVLESYLSHANDDQVVIANAFRTESLHCPLIDDTQHYGRLSPTDKSKSMTNVISDILEEMRKVIPAVADMDAMLDEHTLVAIVKATLGLSPIPEIRATNMFGGEPEPGEAPFLSLHE